MRRHYVIVLLLALLALVGCTLSTQPAVDEPIATSPGNTASGKPTVRITAPKEGDEFVVAQQIFITANATDTAGVTRVQLIANEQVVKTISSESSTGQKNFEILLDYTPRAAGSVVLEVVAYRGAIASDPATVTINVRANQTQVTATSRPVTNAPNINPNDPTCRALINAGLNVRSGPGTNFDRITTLAAGTVVPIVGRTGLNDWWQIRYGTVVGWVSAPFTSVLGICSAVPVIPSPATPTPRVPTATNRPPATAIPTSTTVPPTNTPGRPDLVITSITGPTSVDIATNGATQRYNVTITNTGSGPSGSFVNDFSGPSGTTDLGTVSGLNAGESISLTIDVTFTGAGSINLGAVADSGGQVSEISEVNNNASLTVTVT